MTAHSPLYAIVVACLAGGVLAILAAAGTLALHARWISKLVSFAVGALLGAVFLELLPHALEHGSTAGCDADGSRRPAAFLPARKTRPVAA